MSSQTSKKNAQKTFPKRGVSCAKIKQKKLDFFFTIAYNDYRFKKGERIMDKRVSYFIGVDTETCNGLVTNDGKLDLSQSLVYDIGWAICDKRGRIYKTRSFLVAEVFCDMKDIMRTAYYSEKLPSYWEDIKAGRRILATLYYIRKKFREDCEEWNIKAIFAHNALFDLRALNNTIRYITKSRNRYFFPYGIEIWDTLKMSRQTIGNQKTYKRFCEKNGYMTAHKKPRVRLTAEVLYRYITGNNDFNESHTGLEDVLIEIKIFNKCVRQHKKMEKRLFS